MLRRASLSLVLGSLAAIAAWASLADGKVGWTVDAAAVAAVAGAFAPTVFDAIRNRDSLRIDLEIDAQVVAVAAMAQVRASSVRARLIRPLPMSVQFTSRSGAGARRSAVIGNSGLTWETAPLSGSVLHVADCLRKLPWRQLIVVGEPGAGKSVLATMLTEQLLQDLKSGDPVPLLIGISSWDPHKESVTGIIARRLTEEFGISEEAAQKLASEPRVMPDGTMTYWVMPILDGLDEVAPASQHLALTTIDAFAASNRPIVVTCRTREYLRAESEAGVVSHAAVVQMLPLHPEDIVEFLPGPSDKSQASWIPITDEIQANPNGLLAKTLSSPLLAGLAKDGFDGREPSTILAARTRSSLIRILVDRYVEVVYSAAAPRDALSTTPRSPESPRYSHTQAAQWLSSIALLGNIDGTRDIRWWTISWSRVLRHPRLAAVTHFATLWLLTAALTVLLGDSLSLWSNWSDRAIAVATASSLITTAAFGAFKQAFTHEFQGLRSVRTLRFRGQRILRSTSWASRLLASVTVSGTWGGGVALLSGDVRFGLIGGLTTGTIVFATEPRRRNTQINNPKESYRKNHQFAGTYALQYGLSAIFGFSATGHLFSHAPLTSAVSLSAAMFSGLAMLSSEATWFRFRRQQFTAALFIRRRSGALLPVRLVRFLGHGTTSDVATLRVNGPAWQFRHAIIQDFLADHVSDSRLHPRNSYSAHRHRIASLRDAKDLEGLRKIARTGDREAGREFIELVRESGQIEYAFQTFQEYAYDFAQSTRWDLIQLFREEGRLSSAVHAMAESAARGRNQDWPELIELLREIGDEYMIRGVLDRAEKLGDNEAHRQLLQYQADNNEVGDLREAADAGDSEARGHLVDVLVRQGRADEAVDILTKAARTDGAARWELVQLMKHRGDLVGLRLLAEKGDWGARRALSQEELERGDTSAAIELLNQGVKERDFIASQDLVGALLQHGDLASLDELCMAGSREAMRRRAELLRENGDRSGLVRLVDQGDIAAMRELATLLEDQNEPGEAERILRLAVRKDDYFAARQLARLLQKRGDIDALKSLIRDGWATAAKELIDLLREQGKVDEAIKFIVDHGEPIGAASRRELLQDLYTQGDAAHSARMAEIDELRGFHHLTNLLTDAGRIGDLRLLAEGGNTHARDELVKILCEHGDADEAIAVLRRSAQLGGPGAQSQLDALLRLRGDVG